MTSKQALDVLKKAGISNFLLSPNGKIKLTSAKAAQTVLRKIGKLITVPLIDFYGEEIRLIIKGKTYRLECAYDALDESLINLANSMID